LEQIDRFKGSLLGLVIGDALGATLEFYKPGSFQPITDIVGGGVHELEPGEWTDDTSMALCLAESLLECNGFDAKDQMTRYLKWYREGYFSCKGYCFDIGNATREALILFEKTGQPFSGSYDPWSAGNGSIMRLAPVPMFYANDPLKAIEMSGRSSVTTHPSKETVDACRYFGGLITGALYGCSKEELLSELFSPLNDSWRTEPLTPKIEEIARGSFKEKNAQQVKGSGYVVESLEAALWAFYNTDSFEDGVLLAVNLGDDADTTGAVYGQLAGAYYGFSGLPTRMFEKLVQRQKIESMAEQLYIKKM